MSCRILFINRSYWPDTEATGQLLTELCEDLAATGEFEVHVLCGRPNHAAGDSPQAHSQERSRNGVTIHRVSHTQFGKRSIAGKLMNLASFTASAWWNSRRLPRPDIVVTETDPFFLGLLGRRIQKKQDCRFVAYLPDIYPDVAVAVGSAREGAFVRRWREMLFRAYRAADRVVVLSSDMSDRCTEHGVSAERISVIPNWADTDNIRPVSGPNHFREKHELGEKFVVMYSGNMGLPHLLIPILDAAERFRGRDEVVFLFVGEGVQRADLERDSGRRMLSNVRFLPYQPREFLSHSLSAADVQIVSVKPRVISCLMPSKLYGILAAGSSVLAIAPPDCEMSRLIRDCELGEVCDSSPRESMAEDLTAAIKRLMDRSRLVGIAARARKLAESEFSRARQVERFRELLRRLTNRQGEPLAGERTTRLTEECAVAAG